MFGVPRRIGAAVALSAALTGLVLAGAPSVFDARPAVKLEGPALPTAKGRPQAEGGPVTETPSGGHASAMDIGLNQPSRYWRASELDSKPMPLTPIEPAPPARGRGKAGRVLARVLINESGRADAVRVELSEPQSIFDDAVRAAFGAARYRPGMKGGRTVKSQMLVEVTFPEEPEPAKSALPR